MVSDPTGREAPLSRRLEWLPHLGWLLVLALLGTLPFWLTDLDLRVARLFYHPELDNPWIEGEEPLWSFFYIAAPLLTGLVVFGGLLVLAGGRIWERMRRLRLYAVLVVATALLGPGLLVNGLLKDQWGRPRPHQIQPLGGTRDYLPPLKLGEPGKGKSFPSGHSSVGFMLAVFFLIWRRRRPRLAWLALASAVVLGSLMGLGRMAAGDHFLSDVIWSAVFVYGVALMLYYGVLRIPRREAVAANHPPQPLAPLRRPWLAVSLYGATVVVTLALVLLATPVNQNHRELIQPGELPGDPRVLEIEADRAELILWWTGGPERASIRLEARGFGLPGSRVDQSLTEGSGTARLHIAHLGFFTERDTRLVVGIRADQWDRVQVRLRSGDVRVQTRSGPGPVLDLASADGTVLGVPAE